MKLTFDKLSSRILFVILVITLCRCGADNEQIEYYETGEVKSVDTIDKKGLKQGILVNYYTNGDIMYSETYKNDTLTGPYISYYRNGAVKAKAYFAKGMLEGVKVKYYENGKESSREFYSKDKGNGEFLTFHENGKLLSKSFFKEGTMLYYIKFDSLGNTISEEYPIYLNVPSNLTSDDSIEVTAKVFDNFKVMVTIRDTGSSSGKLFPMIKDGSEYRYTLPPQKKGVYKISAFLRVDDEHNYSQDTIIKVQ